MVMNDDVYKVTGEALKTIELYEEQERKHRESVIMQRLTAILTVVIILLTAAQTGIIKLPTLIDWT